MFETPGISITNSILFGLNAKTLKSVYIVKPLKLREMSLSKGHSIFIGGLAIIELIDGEKTDIACFFHENVQLRKNHVSDTETKFIKLNNKKELMPSLPKVKSTKDMEIFEIEMKNGESLYRDIGFTGLGWVSAKVDNHKFRIYVPKGVSIYTSRPKVRIK